MHKDLRRVKGFLLDLDGTTYLSTRALPGAIEFVRFLQSRKLPLLFISNNPSRDVSEYVEYLRHLGFAVTKEQIITSSLATIHYLKKRQLTQVYAVGTPAFERELENSGLVIEKENPAAVVISFDTTLTYDKIKTAALLLVHHPELPYIATNPDLVCPTLDGPIPDCGSLITLFQAATGRVPIVMGKPHSGMIDLAVDRLGIPKEELAIIGDRLYTDIQMGHDHGMTTILVLSGETRAEDLKQFHLTPDYVVNNLHELLHHLQSSLI